MWDALAARRDEAVDFALAHGLIKAGPQGGAVHAPFTLTPAPIPPALHRQLAGLTAPFNAVVWRLSRDLDALRDTLEPAAAGDPFTARLLELAGSTAGSQPLHLDITRSDYFLQPPDGDAAPRPRQVELNTVAVSYAALAGRAQRLHAYLFRDAPVAAELAPNDPVTGLAEGMAEAFRRFGHSQAEVLHVVQPDELNRFDQRLLEFALRERGVPSRRLSLEALGREGTLREGHLWVAGRPVAIAYLRAGYAPADYPSRDAWRGRELIEHADAIALPGVAVQLAGSKKVQQRLSRPEALARFCDPADPAEAGRLHATFAGLYDPEEPVTGPEGELPAWRAALQAPSRYVLKPQREGGGNNLFDEAMVAFLADSTPARRRPYILMERIAPAPRRALMVARGEIADAPAVSEIGRFGLLLADGARLLRNADVGYLVRTKHAGSTEGGVSAGFGHLDSLVVTGSPFPPTP